MSARLASLAGCFALLAASLLGAGCGSTSYTCDPECPTGSHCTADGCVPDNPSADSAVPEIDMAQSGGCNPACSGATPYCNANKLCVPCLMDNQCPAGQICKSVGATSSCVPGCADDSRCAGGDGGASTKKCCGGQCIDVTSDPANCGACGSACGSQHSSAVCQAGTCKPGTCAPGWGDCNNDPKDGCEANLHIDPVNCTMCGMGCVIPNAYAGCADGCFIEACKFGWDDCDGDIGNGCEMDVSKDPKNCGACGNACGSVPHATNACINAACQLTSCVAGFADCNGDPKDGCEVGIYTDAKNCGSCGAACQQGLVCVNGGCTCPQCNIPNAATKCVNNVCMLDHCLVGYTDCNNNPNDGCEAATGSDPNNCGACGMVCPKNLPGCLNGQCVNAWFPVGVQQSFPAGQLAGWTECYRDQYSNGNTALTTILNQCSGSKLMLACGQHANPNTITLGAWAPRSDVLFMVPGGNCGGGQATHLANGVGWYYNSSWSWGFVQGGDTADLCSCDTSNVDPQFRMCWHTSNGNINGGYRCGASTGLNGDATWDRIVYQIP